MSTPEDASQVQERSAGQRAAARRPCRALERGASVVGRIFHAAAGAPPRQPAGTPALQCSPQVPPWRSVARRRAVNPHACDALGGAASTATQERSAGVPAARFSAVPPLSASSVHAAAGTPALQCSATGFAVAFSCAAPRTEPTRSRCTWRRRVNCNSAAKCRPPSRWQRGVRAARWSAVHPLSSESSLHAAAGTPPRQPAGTPALQCSPQVPPWRSVARRRALNPHARDALGGAASTATQERRRSSRPRTVTESR